MNNIINIVVAQAPLSALVLMCIVGTALAEDTKPCQETETLYEGRCVPKTHCPTNATSNGSTCAHVLACSEGTHRKQRRACVDFDKECEPGMRWIERRNRCVVKGAECSSGLTWVPSKNRCVVRGTECHEGLVWSVAMEHCELRTR